MTLYKKPDIKVTVVQIHVLEIYRKNKSTGMKSTHLGAYGCGEGGIGSDWLRGTR